MSDTGHRADGQHRCPTCGRFMRVTFVWQGNDRPLLRILDHMHFDWIETTRLEDRDAATA